MNKYMMEYTSSIPFSGMRWLDEIGMKENPGVKMVFPIHLIFYVSGAMEMLRVQGVRLNQLNAVILICNH